MKQQMHHPLLPQAGLLPSANFAYTSQPNAAFQPSLACPSATQKVFQPGSSALSTPLDNIIKGRLETQIVANNSAWLNKTIPTSSSAERARAPNDSIDAMNHRPSKLSKLNDRRSSYSAAQLN